MALLFQVVKIFLLVPVLLFIRFLFLYMSNKSGD